MFCLLSGRKLGPSEASAPALCCSTFAASTSTCLDGPLPILLALVLVLVRRQFFKGGGVFTLGLGADCAIQDPQLACMTSLELTR